MGKAWLWSADDGGCGWYRTQIVAEALRGLGHDVGQGITFDPAYEDADAVLGQRISLAGATSRWAQWAFERKRTLVFDADDDYFHLSQHPEFGRAAVEYGQSRVQARLLANAFCATHTTCASELLAEMFSVYCNNVRVVPNGLPERYLAYKAPWERLDGMTAAERGLHRPVVGWAGSAFTQWELTSRPREALLRSAEWGARLHTVGVPYPVMKKIGMATPGTAVTGWVQGSANYLDTIDFDIWVAPYRSTPYNEAKAPTKALEAAFLGIPIVASNTTPYRDFVIDGVTGFLVGPGDSWSETIQELIRDPWLRESMGRAAREKARQYTIEKLAAELWAPILFGESG